VVVCLRDLDHRGVAVEQLVDVVGDVGSHEVGELAAKHGDATAHL
jgi:hypothetical protein